MSWLYRWLVMWVAMTSMSLRPIRLNAARELGFAFDITWTLGDPVVFLHNIVTGALREMRLPVVIPTHRFAWAILPAEDPANDGGQMFVRLESEARAEAARLGMPVPDDFAAAALYVRFVEAVRVLSRASAEPGGREHMSDVVAQITPVPGAAELVRRIVKAKAEIGDGGKVGIFTAWGSEVAALLVNLLGLGDLNLQLITSETFPRERNGRMRDKDEFQTIDHAASQLGVEPHSLVLFDDSPVVCFAAGLAGTSRIIAPLNPIKSLADYYEASQLAARHGLRFHLVKDLTRVQVER